MEKQKKQLEKLCSGKQIPDFNPGDTIKVDVKVVESPTLKEVFKSVAPDTPNVPANADAPVASNVVNLPVDAVVAPIAVLSIAPAFISA